MYTGTLIDDLIRAVERAEKKARQLQEFTLELQDHSLLRESLRPLEVA